MCNRRITLSEFKELIKNFSKTRDYVRDFFVYGFKTRDDFNTKSARTYDNERRRIESWLSDFIKQKHTSKGKNIFLSIDSNLLDTNPLYEVWKTKSFTDNDIMLHFFILDYLSDELPKNIEEIADGISENYEVIFDTQLIRRKCNDYVKEGLLISEKQGKQLLYKIASNFNETITNFPLLKEALKFYQFSSPLGIVANTILDNISTKNDIFRIKHSFLVHTLEDEILLQILNAIQQKRIVKLYMMGSKSHHEMTKSAVPLQIFTSTRSGRRFLCVYFEHTRRFSCLRMDAIKKVMMLESVSNYDEIRSNLDKNRNYIWGVSFENSRKVHLDYVKLTLHIDEYNEMYILTRLETEGKGGTITRIAPNTYTYETEIFDSHEMLPWLRTFIGRIIDIESSNEYLHSFFFNDIKKMFEMYEIE